MNYIVYAVILTKGNMFYAKYDNEQLAKDTRDGLNEMCGRRAYKVKKIDLMAS